MLTHPTPGHDEALAGIDAIRAELARLRKTAVIAVVDAHGELIALVRLDGAPLSSVGVAANKAFTAARLQRPSRALAARVREPGVDIAFWGDPRYTAFGGGLPIVVDGKVAGAVAVSGLTEDEDEALATIGVDAILRAVARA